MIPVSSGQKRNDKEQRRSERGEVHSEGAQFQACCFPRVLVAVCCLVFAFPLFCFLSCVLPVSVRLVGKGSFGSVYLVSRRRDGANFVLKNMEIKNVPDKEIEVSRKEKCTRREGEWEELFGGIAALTHPGFCVDFIVSPQNSRTRMKSPC
jgi:hypothetical protein